MINRIFVGTTLVVIFSICIYFSFIVELLIAINLASLYDAYNLVSLHPNIALIITLIMPIFNFYMFYSYQYNQEFVMKVILITQLSDIYQYLFGTFWGRHKIGYISKNKTYEGFLLGFIFTILTFIWLYPLIDIILIYFCGILSGLCSSYIKRKLEIKDYSNLLGSHGGWIDRIDSIIIPMLFLS